MPILDQMNVKANESDTQGTDYDIRDRKLTTATSQSGVNTSDVVLLKDTSGNYHEITKDSFMGAVRSALGSLIKNYDKGTNVNGIAVTGSTGTVNDLGFSSPSDLASVLGEMYLTENGDFNDFNDAPIGIVRIAKDSTMANRPANYNEFRGWLITFKPSHISQAYVFQQYIDCQVADAVFYRARTYNGEWSNWEQYSFGIPSFYKDYSTLASLASALGDNRPSVDVTNLASLSSKTGIYKTLSDGVSIPIPNGNTCNVLAISTDGYTTLEIWHINEPNERFTGYILEGNVNGWYKHSWTLVQ